MDDINKLIREIDKAQKRWEETHYTIPTGIILGVDLYNILKCDLESLLNYDNGSITYASLIGLPIEIDYKRKRRCSLTIDIDVPYV